MGETRRKSIALTTPVEWKGVTSSSYLRYGAQLMSLGSCFSDTMAHKLYSLGFSILVNPYGTLYNPLSIARALDDIASPERFYTADDLLYTDGRWVSLMHHSSLSDVRQELLLDRLNDALQEARSCLADAQWLVLTFGSSYYYQWKESGAVVANCHRIPADQFIRRLASVEEMYNALTPVLDKLLAMNPTLQVLLSISPIRYMAYGAAGNASSKARLVLLRELLEERYGERLLYFPAYEIVLDELRDYRFYAEDMVHPSEVAIQILFERLMSGWLDPKDYTALQKAEAFQRLVHHRPKDKALHLARINEAADRLSRDYPQIAVEQIMEI